MKRLLLVALGLVFLVFCTSCQSAAEREQKEREEKQQAERKKEVRTALDSLLDQRLASLSQEDQRKWQMRDVCLFGPFRFYGFIGDWEIVRLLPPSSTPARGNIQVEGVIWYEGLDLAGQGVKRQAKLSVTLLMGVQPRDWRLVDYQVVEPNPLPFWRQFYTWAWMSFAAPFVAMFAFADSLGPWLGLVCCLLALLAVLIGQAASALYDLICRLFICGLAIVGGATAIIAPAVAAWHCFHSYPACVLGGLAFLVLYLAGIAAFRSIRNWANSR
jgi:hypothetical protein